MSTQFKCPWCDEWGRELIPADAEIVSTPSTVAPICSCCNGVAYYYNLSDRARAHIWEDYLTDIVGSHPQIGPLVHPPNGERPLHPLRALELVWLLSPATNQA